MSKFQIDDLVNVGGCVGKITEIADHQILVEGIYHDVGGYSESWQAKFIENDVMDASKIYGCWDFRNIYAIWS